MKNFVKALFILFLTFGHMSCSKNDDEPKKETLQPAKAIMMTFYEPDGSISITSEINIIYQNEKISKMTFDNNGEIETRIFNYDPNGKINKVSRTSDGVENSLDIVYNGNNFTITYTDTNGSKVSDFIFNSTTNTYTIHTEGSPLKPTIEFDDLGNITKVDDTSFLVITKSINSELPSIYRAQDKLFPVFNLFGSGEFFSGIIFGNHSIDKVTFTTGTSTLNLIATNVKSDIGISKLSLTNEADGKLYLEALISY